MKKIFGAILLVVLFFLVGCETTIEKRYELDLSSIEESMNIDDFDVSLIRIKEIIDGNIKLINCDETMFTEEDYNKLSTVGTHTVTVIYKLFTEQFTITLYNDTQIELVKCELDINNLPSAVNMDDFDISLIKIKETYSDESVNIVDCNESMLSSEDLSKLLNTGEHTIVINYNQQQFTVTIILYENTEPTIEYEYELDLSELRQQIYIEDFDLSLIAIKEIDSLGNVRYIECNQTMVSSSDLAKLQNVGTHSITINYKEFSGVVTITLMESNSGGGNDTPTDGFSSTLAYYSSAIGKTGTELKMALRTIITSTHKKVTTYAELKEYLQEADEDPNNPRNMLLFYNGVSVTKSANMDVWNREHVWPQSLGWFKTSGAGADMHHLRPCNPSVNSSRGNTKFGTSSGYYDPSKFGVDYRGDVARIIFYLFTRYSEADKYTFTTVAQSKDILLEWNRIDPVSETEIIRNDYTYTIQKNRNPFIDHPECADLIWGTSGLLNNDEFDNYSIEIIYYLEEKKYYEYL